MKEYKFLSIISVLSLIFILIGTTFSFFSVTTGSRESALAANSSRVGVNVTVSLLYDGHSLIPMNDSDIMTAYEHQCVDINNYGACQAYTIDVDNIGDEFDYQGTINFNIGNITNLNYIVLDEEDHEIARSMQLQSGTDLSLGDTFTLPKDASRHFKLLIWLSNFERNQNLEDAGGNYGALISFESVGGYKITGSISGS